MSTRVSASYDEKDKKGLKLKRVECCTVSQDRSARPLDRSTAWSTPFIDFIMRCCPFLLIRCFTPHTNTKCRYIETPLPRFWAGNTAFVRTMALLVWYDSYCSLLITPETKAVLSRIRWAADRSWCEPKCYPAVDLFMSSIERILNRHES
jgi:hypothetical protein